jgi:hypothetical protein
MLHLLATGLGVPDEPLLLQVCGSSGPLARLPTCVRLACQAPRRGSKCRRQQPPCRECPTDPCGGRGACAVSPGGPPGGRLAAWKLPARPSRRHQPSQRACQRGGGPHPGPHPRLPSARQVCQGCQLAPKWQNVAKNGVSEIARFRHILPNWQNTCSTSGSAAAASGHQQRSGRSASASAVLLASARRPISRLGGDNVLSTCGGGAAAAGGGAGAWCC